MSRPASHRNGKMQVDYLLNPQNSREAGSTSNKNAHKCQDCALTYSIKSNLNKHIKSKHRNQKPHKCNLCNSAFPFSDGLRRHIKLIHSEQGTRPYPCPRCPSSFKQRSHLAKHINSVHQPN